MTLQKYSKIKLRHQFRGYKTPSKYLFKNLFDEWLDIKSHNVTPSYLAKIKRRHELYILPSLANKDAREITSSNLRDILKGIVNINNPTATRLDTVRRLINDLIGIFSIPFKDEYINRNPADGLADEFPTPQRHSKQKGLDSRLPAITDRELLKEFIIDFKNDNRMNLQTKRAIYLLILTANRPINVVNAKCGVILT